MDPTDLRNFISNFNQSGQDNFKTSGCKLGGEKYMYLSSNEKVARFKKGTSGVHTIKTTQGKHPPKISYNTGNYCYIMQPK